MAYVGGPHIQAACFCEMVIEDKTGVMSLIRIIDTLTHTETGPNPPEDIPPVPVSMKLVLMLKSGKARGRSSLRIIPEFPTGATQELPIYSLHFEGEEKGHNFVLNLAYIFPIEGLYWFHIYIEEEKLTSIPFRVKYNRIVTSAQ
jgi:hypothetical protein